MSDHKGKNKHGDVENEEFLWVLDLSGEKHSCCMCTSGPKFHNWNCQIKWVEQSTGEGKTTHQTRGNLRM